jgi:hypothetical protein
MAEVIFNEKQNDIDNIFANVIRIGGNVLSIATDAIDKMATPQQAKAEILKMVKEIEIKLGEIKDAK